MIPDGGCKSDQIVVIGSSTSIKESAFKETLEYQTHGFKLKHGYTVSELRRKYLPEKPVDLTEVMTSVIESVKGGYKTALYKGCLTEKELTTLQLFDYTVVKLNNGTYEISGWSDV